MHRNDMAPMLAGIIVGDVIGRLAFHEPVGGCSYVSLALAGIYLVWLGMDAFGAMCRPL